MVLEHRTLEWFACRAETIEIRCNAHRDAHTTIVRHLLHRERMGDEVQFENDLARAECLETATLWELSLRRSASDQIHVAAPTLERCIHLLQTIESLQVAQNLAA